MIFNTNHWAQMYCTCTSISFVSGLNSLCARRLSIGACARRTCRLRRTRSPRSSSTWREVSWRAAQQPSGARLTTSSRAVSTGCRVWNTMASRRCCTNTRFDFLRVPLVLVVQYGVYMYWAVSSTACERCVGTAGSSATPTRATRSALRAGRSTSSRCAICPTSWPATSPIWTRLRPLL